MKLDYSFSYHNFSHRDRGEKPATTYPTLTLKKKTRKNLTKNECDF